MQNLINKYENHDILGPHLDLLTKTRGSEHTSSKYKAITTLEVLDHFISRGFTASSLNKTFATSEKNKGFEKHKIILDAPKDLQFKIDGLTPKLHVLNSYNAQQSLQFFLGVYRLVCSNGLVIGKGIFHERIVHTGNVNHKLDAAFKRTTTAFDAVASNVFNWQNLTLDQSQIDTLATRLIRVRLGKSTEKVRVEARSRDICRASRVVRLEDKNNDLFTVFNRIQESVLQRPQVSYLRADLSESYYSPTVRKIRKLTPIAEAEMNAKFWTVANEYYNEIKEVA